MAAGHKIPATRLERAGLEPAISGLHEGVAICSQLDRYRVHVRDLSTGKDSVLGDAGGYRIAL